MCGTIPPQMNTPPRAPKSNATSPATEPRKETKVSSVFRHVAQDPVQRGPRYLGRRPRQRFDPVQRRDRPVEVQQPGARQDPLRRNMGELPSKDCDDVELVIGRGGQRHMAPLARNNAFPPGPRR